MEITKFEELKELLKDKKIYGQIFSALIRTDSGLTAAAKKEGYCKVSSFQARLYKAESCIEKINTSTGMVDAGLTYSGKRESYYEGEALNGFFSHLRSNPEKKYIELYFTPSDKSLKSESVYFDDKGIPVLDEATINSITTPSSRKPKKSIPYELSEVSVKQIKWENILELNISGQRLKDPEAKRYSATEIYKRLFS